MKQHTHNLSRQRLIPHTMFSPEPGQLKALSSQ